MMSPAKENSEVKQKKKGHIELILGPMFSGKSTELMRRLKRYKVRMKSNLEYQYSILIIILGCSV